MRIEGSSSNPQASAVEGTINIAVMEKTMEAQADIAQQVISELLTEAMPTVTPTRVDMLV